MSFYDTFTTDANLENDRGIDLDYGADGIITIHRAGGANRKFQRVMEGKMRPYRRRIENGTLENEVAERLLAEVYAEAVVVGWSGVKDRKGKDMPFSSDNAVTLLTDLPDLFRDIQEQAGRVANFRAAEIDADVKN